ncbi:hypothetical protein NQ315_006181 [Exocentrus adspersus]|uniref:AN1-type domain-containing protein n=1 Tax=Exocentrus adspersus TaxID=1586481 RepID=A0AAV8VZI0_9CUCU|nr:hypothetical protein NQ315_006181 [Exocentrus adspersus]
MTSTVTQTKTKLKIKDRDLKEAVNAKDLDEVLQKVTDVDTICHFTKCKNRTKDFAIQCKYCNKRFCTSHGLPEIHGCGEAVRRDEKRKFLHPDVKLSQEKHSQAQTKLTMKLKQMQLERKAKQNLPNKSKK